MAVAALTVDLLSGGEGLRILPVGEFRARDGRPLDVPAWTVTPQSAARLVARVGSRKDDLVVDYEHQTLVADKNGQEAPAAGWIKPHLEARADGIYAVDVEWTERAKARIAAKEYRYFSPVFSYDKKTGEVIDLHMGALTNNAGLDGLTDLTARAAARFNYDQPHEDNAMTKEQLALLGLAEGATAEQITTALTALKAKAEGAEAATTELAALKSAQPDPAKFVPVAAVAALQTEVAALKTAQTEREVNDTITAAKAEGKILPPMEAWARDLGKKDIAALKSFVAAAQPIAALKGTQTGGHAPGGNNSSDDTSEAACKSQWESNAALRDEFDSLASYTAYQRANASGRIRLLAKK